MVVLLLETPFAFEGNDEYRDGCAGMDDPFGIAGAAPGAGFRSMLPEP